MSMRKYAACRTNRLQRMDLDGPQKETERKAEVYWPILPAKSNPSTGGFSIHGKSSERLTSLTEGLQSPFRMPGQLVATTEESPTDLRSNVNRTCLHFPL